MEVVRTHNSRTDSRRIFKLGEKVNRWHTPRRKVHIQGENQWKIAILTKFWNLVSRGRFAKLTCESRVYPVYPWMYLIILYCRACNAKNCRQRKTTVILRYLTKFSTGSSWKTFLKVSTIKTSLVLLKTLIFIINITVGSICYQYFILAIKPWS